MNLWERQAGKFLRQQVRASRTMLPKPLPAVLLPESEDMDRFVMRGHLPFPAEAFADSDVKSARVVVESPVGTVVLDETRDLPVNAAGDDWDFGHADVVQLEVDPVNNPGQMTPFLKTSGTFEAEQGATYSMKTTHLDDADPQNPSPETVAGGTVADTVAPGAPLSAILKAESEINVPNQPTPPNPNPNP